MNQDPYMITFPNVSVAEANRYAEDLRGALQNVLPNAQIQQRRDNPHTMDLGTTLVLVLGTSSLKALAIGIGNWLQRHQTASVTIEISGKKVIAQNITAKDVVKLTELLLPEE
jgi:hypothetical protein